MLSKNNQDNIFDFYIFSIAHALRYINDQKLLEYNITNRQARLLGIIYRNLQNKEDINNQKLQAQMNLKGPSVTSLLNGLEKNAFIIRKPKSQDRRSVDYQLMPKSIDLIEEMEQVFAKTEKLLLKDFNTEEKQSFLKLLNKAYKNIDDTFTNK